MKEWHKTKDGISMDFNRTEKNGKSKINLDMGYSSNNAIRRIIKWSSNNFLMSTLRYPRRKT